VEVDDAVSEGVGLFGDESLSDAEAEYDDDDDDFSAGEGEPEGDVVRAAEKGRKGGRSCLKDMAAD